MLREVGWLVAFIWDTGFRGLGAQGFRGLGF